MLTNGYVIMFPSIISDIEKLDRVTYHVTIILSHPICIISKSFFILLLLNNKLLLAN